MTLFEQIELHDATAAKNHAIAEVWDHAADEWKETAKAALKAVCLACDEFTTDELDELRKTAKEPRALGGLMKEGERRGWCIPTDKYQSSKSARNHRRAIRVWRSLLFRGEP